VTGEVAVAYQHSPDGVFAVPEVISASGAAVVAAGGGYALVTNVARDRSPVKE
jgi:hypothetical protein